MAEEQLLFSRTKTDFFLCFSIVLYQGRIMIGAAPENLVRKSPPPPLFRQASTPTIHSHKKASVSIFGNSGGHIYIQERDTGQRWTLKNSLSAIYNDLFQI